MRKETKQAFVTPAVPVVWPLVSKLEKSLANGEKVLSVAAVTHNRTGGIIAITDRKVVVRSSGMRPFVAEWPLGSVSSMTATGGVIMGGKLTVTVADGSETVGTKFPTAEKLAAAFREAKAAAETRGQGVPAPAGSFSAADELAKFHGLLQAGAITQAEFNAKKAELL